MKAFQARAAPSVSGSRFILKLEKLRIDNLKSLVTKASNRTNAANLFLVFIRALRFILFLFVIKGLILYRIFTCIPLE